MSHPADSRDPWRLYEEFAARFDGERGRNVGEEAYLRIVADRLPPDAEVLDLGCGAGEPIARFFVEKGYAVTGVDAAPAMIALCRSRFPDAEWRVADMRALSPDRRFGAIIAWDSFFHLRAVEQRAMFPRFHGHAAPGCMLLFTSGPAAGEAIGDLYGRKLYHASLDAAEYRALLDANGFDIIVHRVEDPKCGGHTVWLAERQA
jgi:SAM-dependent methyltransferase